MSLLVVALASEETSMLTLAEWDALVGCERVLFERPDHPLLERLRAAGVAAGPFDDEPDPEMDGWALVAEPSSARVVDLARRGAEVRIGAAITPDALTAAHAAPIARRAASSLGGLAAIMARLRSVDGCPWDREQDHESLRVHLIEEAHEVLDAIDRGHLGTDLEEELGDLLLQVAFHAQLAADDGRFDLAGVADAIVAKLLRRHPHVFGDVTVGGAHDVIRNWEQIKSEEKERSGPFDGIPQGLPALLNAYKVQKRAAQLSFSSDATAATAAIRAALDREPSPEVLGEMLFWVVGLARAAGVDPEGALRAATTRFKDSLT